MSLVSDDGFPIRYKMFKSLRWRGDKNKLKIAFKLQFRVSQVDLVDDEPLTISIVPPDTNKPTLKSDRVGVRERACLWENPLYETVLFTREPKSGKIHEKLYHFVVGNSSSKSGVIGEASLDFALYAEATRVSVVSLPLNNSKMPAMLHVTIQRMHESNDQREAEEIRNTIQDHKDHSFRSRVEETAEPNLIDGLACRKKIVNHPTELSRDSRGSSRSDTTLSSLDSASGNELPWQPQTKHGNCWLGDSNSTREARADDSSSELCAEQQNREEFAEIAFEKLKSDFSVLSRQAEMWEDEIHSLRKQIATESKKSQNLSREVVCLKEERDALKGECEKIRKLKGSCGDHLAFIEELKQELNHERKINTNLRIQLQKTQESNSELILAVRDLDGILEQRSRETLYDEDVEQKASEELVEEHSETKEGYLLEQQLMDLRSEIEIYKRDKDELVLRMEKLAQDHEITKQENQNMACKLEQSQVQELEIQIENLEKELQLQSKEYSESSERISGLVVHVKNLEDELEKLEADLESLTRSKVEQENRAVKAEEMLRQMRQYNGKTVEGIREKLKRLSVQILSTFEDNEKSAAKALTEANELRQQKHHLEEMVRKDSQEDLLKVNEYEVRLNQMSGKVKVMANQIEEMELEIKKREVDLEHQKKHAEEIQRALRDEITELKHEIETFAAASEEMKISVEDMELLVRRGKDERTELENKAMSAKIENEESKNELNKIRILLEDKEVMVRNLQTEVDSIRKQCDELKHSMLEDETEKSKLKKQVLVLKSDLKKKEDSINILEKKMIKDRNVNGRGTTSKIHPRASKEVTNLKERIKLLEDQIKLKETELEASTERFLEKEKDLCRKVEELEEKFNSNDVAKARQEMEVLKERNKSMEDELKEMQERYSEISLMFAEVEGERQQLVMKLRSLKNATN